MIGRLFHRLPIRHKLVAMLMSTSAAVLILATLGFLVSDYFRTRADLVRELESQAHLILENSQAALQFGDEQAAEQTLATLAGTPHIRAACLYTAERELFAVYRRDPAGRPCPPAGAPDGHQFLQNRLELYETGEFDDRIFGTLFLRSDLDVLTGRLQLQGFIVALLLIFAMGVALALASWLQAVVSEPLLALARTAGEVSRKGDYSLRAARSTEDEIGQLADEFNLMLDHIEARDADLTRANEDLRREVAERRRAEQERAELLVREQEASRLKDEFLATLSHELRTPLNAILGWTKLLRAQAVPPEETDKALEKVERNAQVQSRLVEDLLEVSRIVSGKLRLEVRPFDLVSLANTAVESIRPAAEARGTTVERKFGALSLTTVGDPDRLQQVIWNLLSNAVKFTPPRGTVTLSLGREARYDTIEVKDTGVGIDPAFLPNVFDTFRQADASTTRSYGGLGLGLSIVRHLVQMHGGDVAAYSDGPGRGSTFVVRLPVRADERAGVSGDATRARRPDGDRLSGVRVLVVDDDADTRELLVSVLTRTGAELRVAASADEALAAARDMRPQVLVSDIGMPGTDGCELVARMLSEMGVEAPSIRVALTAFASERDRDRAAAAGFRRHIAKPFDPSDLVRILEELLDADLANRGAGR